MTGVVVGIGERAAVAAESLVGTPFLHQGRSHAGFDCAGMLALVSDAVGWTYHDFLYYHRDPDPEVLVECLRRSFPEAEWDDRRPGTIVVLAQQVDGAAKHVGILVSGGDFVHADARLGRCVREPWRRARERLLRGLFRFGENC